ncbi:MAG TPA: hypothetical protein VFL14_14670 [Xanthomonadales bacterium]|nr:hypothetical protein [Xanthomonadales bacterium]
MNRMTVFASIALAAVLLLASGTASALFVACSCEHIDPRSDMCTALPEQIGDPGVYHYSWQAVGSAVVTAGDAEFATFTCSRWHIPGSSECTARVTVVGPGFCNYDANGQLWCSKDLQSKSALCYSN